MVQSIKRTARCFMPVRQEPYKSWLVTSAPPNSYSIEIGYVDTTANKTGKTLSVDTSYSLNDIRWIDLPYRFTNYAQAKVFGIKNYHPILFRIVGSNDEPNYFKYQ